MAIYSIWSNFFYWFYKTMKANEKKDNSIIFYKALNRPIHLLGVESRLFFLLLLFWVPIPLAWGFSFPILVLTAFIFIILHGIGVLLTRIDNQIVGIYIRHCRYFSHYSSFSGIHAKNIKIKQSVPFYSGKKGFV